MFTECSYSARSVFVQCPYSSTTSHFISHSHHISPHPSLSPLSLTLTSSLTLSLTLTSHLIRHSHLIHQASLESERVAIQARASEETAAQRQRARDMETEARRALDERRCGESPMCRADNSSLLPRCPIIILCASLISSISYLFILHPLLSPLLTSPPPPTCFSLLSPSYLLLPSAQDPPSPPLPSSPVDHRNVRFHAVTAN